MQVGYHRKHIEDPQKQNTKVDLGLELAMRHARKGSPMSLNQLAAFCDCRVNTIVFIERRALNRLRYLLRRQIEEML